MAARIVEADALRGETIEDSRLGLGIAVAADVIRSKRVDRDEQDRGLGALVSASEQPRREGAENQGAPIQCINPLLQRT